MVPHHTPVVITTMGMMTMVLHHTLVVTTMMRTMKMMATMQVAHPYARTRTEIE